MSKLGVCTSKLICFLISGVETDYTEIAIFKDTNKSWKIALFLPLTKFKKIIIVALLLNIFFKTGVAANISS